jgi:hypothetical protein
MHITFFDRIKALFARDEYSYWFKHITDEEKELRRMDSWELAKVIHEANVQDKNHQKRIVAEHMLQVRLVRMQNRAIYVSIIFGLIGVVLGAVLTVIIK